MKLSYAILQRNISNEHMIVQMDKIVVQMKYKVQKQNFSLMNTKIIHINQEVVQTCVLIRVSLGYDYFWHERWG